MKRNCLCHINKQELLQPQWLLASTCGWALPKLWPSGSCHPHGDRWGAAEMPEARWTGHRAGPGQLRCVRKALTQWAQSLASSRPSNAQFLNLIPDLRCSAVCSLCCKLAYILTSPPDSLEQFSQSYWGSVSQAWSPKHSHPIKWLSAFRFWLYLLTIYMNICVSYMCIYLHITYIHVLHILAYACILMLSCVRLCDRMGCNPPGSSVHGIFQAIILEWVAISYSRRFPNSGIEPTSLVSLAMAGGFFTTAPRGNPYIVYMCIHYLYINIMYTK